MTTNSIQRGNVTLNNLDNLEEINARIASRNIPSTNLPPCFSNRPTSTKFTTFLVNSQVNNCVNNTEPTVFSVESVFLPGNRKGPFAGFSNKINDESYLRNQFFAKQECPQAHWAPDSTSELFSYNLHENIRSDNIMEKHPALFNNYNKFGYFNPNPDKSVGIDIFNNSTRLQIKNMEEINK